MMYHSEIYRARSLHRQIKELLRLQERGQATERTLHDIKRLCDDAVRTITDPQYQEKVCEVERHADELFSVDKPSRWARGTQPGVMLMRRLVLRSLDALDERLKSIESLQRASGSTLGAGAMVRYP